MELSSCLAALLIGLIATVALLFILRKLVTMSVRGYHFSIPKITWRFSLKYGSVAIAILVVIMLVKSSVVITPCKEEQSATAQDSTKKCNCF